MFDTSLNHFKSVIVHNFFVAPADRNYLLARFTRITGIPEEFWWQALQAVEKYLKAGLLLNGQSVKDSIGHNIVELWGRYQVLYGNLAPVDFTKPNELRDELWTERTLQQFIEDIARKGHPDSRYGLVSRWENSDDLFKLDQLVFELRRRTIGLDWVVGMDWEVVNRDFQEVTTYRELMLADPQELIRTMSVPSGPLNAAGDNLTDLFYAWNFSFRRSAEDLSRHTTRFVVPRLSAGNSYLYLLWEALELRNEVSQDVVERIRWVLDNIRLARQVERDFEELIRRKTTPS